MNTVAVIGAGVSGLATIKSLLEEKLNIVCYETSSDLGGVWAFKKDRDDITCVMDCTIMNTSKEMSSFSDFPPPKNFPNYMHNSLAKEYYEQYAEEFSLKSYINFRHRVESVRRSNDFEKSGRWEVIVSNLDTGEKKVNMFDAVVVCTGKYSKPHQPRFPGFENFQGKFIHSGSYKSSEPYRDRTVLLIGIGNSSSDIAVDLSSISKKVYISTRSGSWIFSRLTKGGYPLDLAMLRRCTQYLRSIVPYSWVCYFVERLLNDRVDHKLYGLQPKYRALSHYPLVNDELHLKIASGLIQLKSDVECFTESGVVFEDGETVQVDDVIFGTGYQLTFPFLTSEDNPFKDEKLDLYQYVFPPRNKHPTLSFVGFVSAFGPQVPLVEIQSRWVVQVLTRKCHLPSDSEMSKDILLTREKTFRRTGNKALSLIGQKDWIPYCEELASYIGAKPSFWRLLLTDPKLFIRCFLGPALPYIYRLTGPHPWKEARDCILNVEERVAIPFRTMQRKEIK